MFKFKQKYTLARQSQSQTSYAGTSDLFDFENGLRNYNSDIVKKLAQGLGFHGDFHSQITLIDYGAGTGTLAEIWQSMYGITPICVEIDRYQIQILKSKGFKVFSRIMEVDGFVNFVYASNVLEHIENDLKVLKEMRNKIKLGGKIAIYVPALTILFSDLDRNVGHYRRYSKSELVGKVKAAGFEVEDCYYNDCVGVLATFMLKVFGYRNKIGLGSNRSLIFYDKVVYPISKLLDYLLFKHIIGKNLVLFAVNSDNRAE